MGRHYSLLCSLSLFFLVGCGPKFTSSIPKDSPLPRSLAVLPADYSGDISRERIDIVRKALINALRNEDFVVMEDKVVDRICSTPQCPERKVLAENYLVDGFVSLKLKSISENNFFAGYYDSLGGEVAFEDKEGRVLVRAIHTERIKGGLIFESGQVFQGIISQVKRSGDSGFDSLAEKFATRIVQELPQTETRSLPSREEGTEVMVSTVEAQWETPAAYKVCAEGTPHSFASLLLGTGRASLREISPGKYCSVVSALAAPQSGMAQVELRTAFGNSVRKEVSIPVDPPCTLQNRIEVTRTDNSALLSVLCARIGTDRSNESLGCSADIKQCSASKVVLFSSPTEHGPFTKVAEFKKARSSISLKGKKLEAIAVGPGGIASQATALAAKDS